jgi:transcriptional regulator with XRE-family HTH domain
LRERRRWTQADLSRRLGLSQSRLSEIEQGKGSFTAEQFLAILRLFNVPVTHFVPTRRANADLQNALARLGANHLVESQEVLPSDRLDEVATVIREVLVSADSPRHITSLAPVLVLNTDRIGLRKLQAELIEVGLERRLGWVIDNTLEAIRSELAHELPRKWAVRYRRAELVLSSFVESSPRSRNRRGSSRRASRPSPAGSVDILDSDILSTKTLDEVQAASSRISQRWGIATGLQPGDFTEALRAARVAD